MKILFLSTLLFFCASSFAVVGGYKYQFDDAQKQQRFQQLSTQLRCPKCQNQNLADSNSPVAQDLRDKVYQLVQEDQTSDEIVNYMVERYGDFVRYNPPLNLKTLLLWGLPALCLAMGIVLLIIFKPAKSKQSVSFTEQEQAQLEKLKQQAGVDQS